MRILIFGGAGMLGHRLLMHAQQAHEVWATVRGTASQIPFWPEFDRTRLIEKVDALNLEDIAGILSRVQPQVVVNCIGIIKQSPLAHDPLPALLVNAVFPHRLSQLCRVGGIRLIHISTDCVFSGKKGNYVESDQSDATDLYGRTKYLGEVANPDTLTLRTSIIGRELGTRFGLIEWFLSQKGTIRGFTRAIYSGFTTDELSRIIVKHVLPHQGLQGIYHVSCSPISKFDLLQMAKDALQHQVSIEPDASFQCDRSLNSERFRAQTGYYPPPWQAMIKELAETSARYDKSRHHLS